LQEIVNSLETAKSTGNLKDFNIGLRVEDGSVYLSGKVASRQQERLALEAARAANGVQLVINEMTIRGAKPANEESEFEAQPASADSARTRGENALQQASSAERDPVRDAEESTVVTAELTRPADQAPVLPVTTGRDAVAEAQEIAAEIIKQFRVEKERGNLRRFGIDVDVDHGNVWLKGHVASKQQESLAVDIARRVPGVKEVVSNLSITAPQVTDIPQATPRPTDSEIARQIVLLLKEQKDHGRLRNFGIDVQVEQGTVWMSGYVASEAQEHIALNIARYVDGVAQVVDDLTLGTAPVSHHQPLEPSSNHGVPAATNQLQLPLAFAQARGVNHQALTQAQATTPVPMMGAAGGGITPVNYDHPQLPGYAWPSYAAFPNYGAVTYPMQYSPTAWPYIGPFYPYPQVPLGWRKVTLEWDDGWWFLDFKDRH
jgi:osmotically-inducible protein OsmY